MDIEQWEDNDGEGIALASVILTNLKSIPLRSQILMNPNVLIADTGSTDNTTGSMLGAFTLDDIRVHQQRQQQMRIW